MSSRSRSLGSRTVSPRSYTRRSFQARKVYSGGVWRIETQVVDTIQAVTAYTDDAQTMVDTLDGRNRFNAVTHVKYRDYPLVPPQGASYVGPVPALSQLGSGWGEYGATVLPLTGGSFSCQGNNLSRFPHPPFATAPIDWANLVYQVGSQLDGRMQSGQNLLVSLAEIGQTVGMLKNPLNVKNLQRIRKTGLTLSQLAKTPANALLEYQFGWKNLYRDIAAIANVWSEVRAHRQYLEETAERYTSISQSQSVSVSNPSLSLFTLGVAPTYTLKPKLVQYKVTGRFGLSVKRPPQALAWSKFDQVISRLGFTKVSEALWDLVPFSFVVDWFTHINRVLEQRSINWNAYDLRYLGYSLTKEWYDTVDFSSNVIGYWPSRWENTQSGTLGPSVVQKSYERFPGFPTGTSSVGLFGNLSKTQIALGIALIVQRL